MSAPVDLRATLARVKAAAEKAEALCHNLVCLEHEDVPTLIAAVEAVMGERPFDYEPAWRQACKRAEGLRGALNGARAAFVEMTADYPGSSSAEWSQRQADEISKALQAERDIITPTPPAPEGTTHD